MLVPQGMLVDLHPVMPNPRISAAGRDLGPLHQERWAREWLRPTERELGGVVREGVFEPLEALELEVMDRHDTAEDVLADIDDWEYGWISDRVRRRILAAEPPIDVTQRLVLRTYRAR